MPELAVVPLAEPLEDEAPLEDECQCHSPRCARFAAILQNRLISTLETSGALCRGHVHSFSYGYLPCWSQHYSFWASLNGLGLDLAPILRSRWHNFGPLGHGPNLVQFLGELARVHMGSTLATLEPTLTQIGWSLAQLGGDLVQLGINLPLSLSPVSPYHFHLRLRSRQVGMRRAIQ